MARVQLALNVADLDEAIVFYSKLFATEPAKVRPGYANFAVVDPPVKLVLIEDATQPPGSLNHLGVEVDTIEEVAAAQARLEGDGLVTAVEDKTECCYALQDKVWVDGLGGGPWEFYTVLADVEHLAGELRSFRPVRGRMLRRSARPGPHRHRAVAIVLLSMPLWRRLVAELLGSAFLAAAVVGSGIAAQQLSPGDSGLELFENAAATAAGLYALILMLGPISGAHFNPVVSFVDAALGGMHWRHAAAYLPAQVAGCVGGAVVSNLMFSKVAITLSTKDRATGAHFLSEVVATLGLLAVIFALARTDRGRHAAGAVGAYIGAAYFFTSSTSFANPAITVGRMFTDTFAGINPSSALVFISAQLVGGLVAVAVIKTLWPGVTPAEAANVVVPHLTEEVCVSTPIVLFLCIHNAGRSLAAKVLLNHYAEGRVDVRSGGSEPGDELNPSVVGVLIERGLDISHEFPKPLTETDAEAADVVVTMGCGDTCQYSPGKRYLDWELPDPAGLTIEQVRPIVDEIDRRVQALLIDLTALCRKD